MTERVAWSYVADYFEACNCAYGCPCNFNGFPTHGNCRAVVAYRIREGRHGSTDLAGAQFVLAVAWPKAIHEGDGTAALWFDESVTQPQMEALGRILTGQDGGMPHEILAPTLTTVLGPFVAKTEIDWNGTDSKVRVESKVAAEQETFRNPVTNEPAEVHVVLPEGFIFRDAKATNSKRIDVSLDGLAFSDANTSGFSAVVEHSNQA